MTLPGLTRKPVHRSWWCPRSQFQILGVGHQSQRLRYHQGPGIPHCKISSM